VSSTPLLEPAGHVVDPAENRVRGARVDAAGAGGVLRALGCVVEAEDWPTPCHCRDLAAPLAFERDRSRVG
jgi:hypothetical protein